MKILIFGDGYLGQRFVETLPDCQLINSNYDICNRDLDLLFITQIKPDVVINAAGKTGRPNIDWCESHKIETYRSNVIGPLVLAEACTIAGVHFIHIGSGCIFYGETTWRENDFANPKSYYSKTKYAADLALGDLPNVAIIRIRMPVDEIPHPRNLITKLAEYKQVIDVVNSVTVVSDFIKVVHQIAERKLSGIFHAVNPNIISHKKIIRLYTEIVDPKHKCEFIPESELKTIAPRSNAVLSSKRLQKAGIIMRPIDVALRDTMVKYKRFYKG